MEKDKSKTSHSHLLLLFFFFFFAVSPSQGPEVNDTTVSYGYIIESVAVSLPGKSLKAYLSLIKNSSVYGPDIRSLNLVASYETKECIRVRITDSETQRWEIPQEIIPRQSSDGEDFPASHGASLEKQTLSSSTSDLVFALHNTTPFGFSVFRKSNSDILFDSSPDTTDASTSLAFKDQYIQLSSSLPQDRHDLLLSFILFFFLILRK